MIDPAKLRERREAKGFSQGKLSLAAGFARNAVSRIESGARGSDMRLETAVKLAGVLEIAVDELLVKPDPTEREDYDWRFGK